jgi:hypothetical protein
LDSTEEKYFIGRASAEIDVQLWLLTDNSN